MLLFELIIAHIIIETGQCPENLNLDILILLDFGCGFNTQNECDARNNLLANVVNNTWGDNVRVALMFYNEITSTIVDFQMSETILTEPIYVTLMENIPCFFDDDAVDPASALLDAIQLFAHQSGNDRNKKIFFVNFCDATIDDSAVCAGLDPLLEALDIEVIVLNAGLKIEALTHSCLVDDQDFFEEFFYVATISDAIFDTLDSTLIDQLCEDDDSTPQPTSDPTTPSPTTPPPTTPSPTTPSPTTPPPTTPDTT